MLPPQNARPELDAKAGLGFQSQIQHRGRWQINEPRGEVSHLLHLLPSPGPALMFQKILAAFWVGRRVYSRRQAPPDAPATRALKIEFVGSEIAFNQGLSWAQLPCTLLSISV